MPDFPQSAKAVRFGVFEMELGTGELRKRGQKIKLQEQPFAILVTLVYRHGELVTREELYSKLSNHNTYDSKHGLNNAIQKIRSALGDSSENSRFIETIDGRGYRFLLPVQFISANGNDWTHSGEDLFLSAILQIRREFFCTNSDPKLNELHYRASMLVDQHSQHPDRYRAEILLDQIQRALDYSTRSECNRAKHRVSFETAAAVFDDPKALSRYDDSDTWLTLGHVWQSVGPFRRKVLLMVSHDVLSDESGKEHIQIRSARKATKVERRAYDKNKNTDR